jgi:hypothetical protein
LQTTIGTRVTGAVITRQWNARTFGNSGAAAIKELTDEQLDQAIAAIQEMLDKRAADAMTIEGEATDITPALPKPSE